MATDRKQRKVDTENRQFKKEWEVEFFFTEGRSPQAKPVCVICGKTVAVAKKENMKRHHTSLHKGWADKYPLESETRKDKFNSLVVTYRRAVTLMTTSMNPQEKATEASLRIAWILNKNKMPLDSSAVVKECILAASQAMCTDSITKQFEKLPLSNDTNTRRTEKLGKDIRKTLIDKLKTVEDISVCIDESVDNTDIPQLAIFVRFFDTDSRSFREELITLLPMLGKTTGEDIFRAVTSFF